MGSSGSSGGGSGSGSSSKCLHLCSDLHASLECSGGLVRNVQVALSIHKLGDRELKDACMHRSVCWVKPLGADLARRLAGFLKG